MAPSSEASADDHGDDGVPLTPASVFPGLAMSVIDRDTAMEIPAYRRAVKLVSSNLSGLKLAQKNANGDREPGPAFLRQPDPGRTLNSLLAHTVEDLAHYGVAYWVNLDWQTPNGWRYGNSKVAKHKRIVYVPVENVTVIKATPFDPAPPYSIVHLGKRYTVPARAVIAFEATAGRWLQDGARTLHTHRMLEDAVRMYAATPQPLQVIKNNGPRKTSDQIANVLASVEQARRAHSTAFIGRDYDLISDGWDATQIALTDARDQQVLETARLTGIPPLYLAIGIANASHNYANLTQQRLDLLAALKPFAEAIEARLSFDDVTGEGVSVEFDFGPFLRVDPMMRADLYSKLIPLGVVTVEEARAFEALAGYVPIDTAPSNIIEQPETPHDTPGMGPE